MREFDMGLSDWLFRRPHRGGTKAGTMGAAHRAADEYAETERDLLLGRAEEIKKATNPLDELMLATSGFSAAIQVLRRRYGFEAVEENSPAERMIAGFARVGDRDAAGRLLDNLLRDLRRFDGNREQTWRLMVMMINPTSLKLAAGDAVQIAQSGRCHGAKEESAHSSDRELPPLSAEMRDTIRTTVGVCSRQIERCLGQGITAMPYVSAHHDDIVATYALGFLQGSFLSNHADTIWAKGDPALADIAWFASACGVLSGVLGLQVNGSDDGTERLLACQARLPQFKGQKTHGDWYNVEVMGGTDAMKLGEGKPLPDGGRLLGLLDANLSAEEKKAAAAPSAARR